MTKDTTHIPLDERALQVARDTVKTKSAYNQLADISTVADVAIRAYLQTAAADVSGLVDRLEKDEVYRDGSGYVTRKRGLIATEAASTIQTLSASNAALEAENARLREALRQTEYLLTKDSFGAIERLNDGLRCVRQARAALSAPKGDPDHG